MMTHSVDCPHSPITDSSEDSVEVRVGPIRAKGPLKKRLKARQPPFRPWSPSAAPPPSSPSPLQQPIALVKRVPHHPDAVSVSEEEARREIACSVEAFPALLKQQRNYKNMTRERRIEANARERTRVHTISAAFETLRKAIPAYSHNQKLSKLSVLRIACSYIMTLSSLVNEEEDEQTRDCVELVTKTIQREGKLRKKKDDND